MKQNNMYNSSAKQPKRKGLPLKTVDTSGLTSITNSGGIIAINLPVTQGTANGQRTGDEVEILSIECRRFYVYGDAIGNVVRFILFQTSGVGTLVSGIGSVLSNGGSGAPDVTSHVLPFYGGNYIRVIHDECVNTCQSSAKSIVYKSDRWKPEINTIPFAPGTVNAFNGVLYLLVVSDSGVVPNPALEYSFRVWYRDV
jgi:hypothetical protein